MKAQTGFLLLVTAWTSYLSAAPLLSVDFNSGSSPTESGPPAFSAFNINSTPATASMSFSTDPVFTSGTTTVSLSSSSGLLDSRDREGLSDNGAFTFAELYRDFVTTLDNDQTLQLQVTGLNPNTLYSLTFYAFDNLEGIGTLTDTFTNTTAGSQPSSSGSLTQPDNTLTSNTQYALSLDAVSDPSGSITFSVTVNEGTSPRLDGLQISVPEPSSVIFGAIGFAFIFAHRLSKSRNG